MTPEELNVLEELARAATPGPWESELGNGQLYRIVYDAKIGDDEYFSGSLRTFLGWPDNFNQCAQFTECDARYIAKSNPDTVLRMIAYIRELERIKTHEEACGFGCQTYLGRCSL